MTSFIRSAGAANPASAVAYLTIPLNVARESERDAVAAIFQAALGTSGIIVDLGRSKVSMRYRFPGDIDSVMREVHGRGLTLSATLAVAVHVVRDPVRSDGTAGLRERLEALPAVSNVAFDGKVLSATVAAASAAMRALYDEIVLAGFVPVDAPAHSRTGALR